MAARRRRVRHDLGERRRRRRTGGAGIESCACHDRARRFGASRTRRCALPGAGDRRRSGSAEGHDRPLPRQRVVAPHCGVGTERRVRLGCMRTAAGADAAVSSLGGDGRGDRLVRRTHTVRAVDPAGRRDGGVVGNCVRNGPRAQPGPHSRTRRDRVGADRPAAGVVDRILAVGGCNCRCLHGGAVVGDPPPGVRPAGRFRSVSRSGPRPG